MKHLKKISVLAAVLVAQYVGDFSLALVAPVGAHDCLYHVRTSLYFVKKSLPIGCVARMVIIPQTEA